MDEFKRQRIKLSQLFVSVPAWLLWLFYCGLVLNLLQLVLCVPRSLLLGSLGAMCTSHMLPNSMQPLAPVATHITAHPPRRHWVARMIFMVIVQMDAQGFIACIGISSSTPRHRTWEFPTRSPPAEDAPSSLAPTWTSGAEYDALADAAAIELDLIWESTKVPSLNSPDSGVFRFLPEFE